MNELSEETRKELEMAGLIIKSEIEMSALKNIELSEIHEVHIDGVVANEDGLGFSIGWSGEKGFGSIRIFEHTKNDMFFEIDSENMSKEFVEKVLLSLLVGSTF